MLKGKIKILEEREKVVKVSLSDFPVFLTPSSKPQELFPIDLCRFVSICKIILVYKLIA